MVDRVVRPLVQAVVAVLLTALVAVTTLAAGLRLYVYNETVYRNVPNDPAFVRGMTEYVLSGLEDECLFYDLPFDTMKTAVTEELIRSFSKEYTAAVYASLCSGEAIAPFTVDPSVYRPTLDAFFASLPEEKRPLDPLAAQTLSEELAKSTGTVLSSGLINSALGYGHDFVYGNTPLRRFASLVWWLLAAALVLLGISLIPWGGFKNRVYATAGSVFVGASLAFVPLFMLKQHNLAERLVLGESPLKLYVKGLLDSVVNGITAVALWVFIFAAVFLLAAVVLLLKGKRNSK